MSNAEELTPTTPRPNARFSDKPPKEIAPEGSPTSTPTRHDFGGLHGQRPLPEEPFTPSKMDDQPMQSNDVLSRENSHRSLHSHHSSDSQDIEMADDDEEGEDGSDNESITSDSQPPSKKKKKGQRFFCTDFPPCQLSFTRSEHLARHIRFVHFASVCNTSTHSHCLENTLESAHSNAIAHVVSQDSTTCGSTLRRSTSMKRYPAIRLPPPAHAFNGRSEPTESDHPIHGQDHRR